MTGRRTYVHESGRVDIEESDRKAEIEVELGTLELKKDSVDGGILLRNPAFPAQIGTGKTPGEALDSLAVMVKAYIEMFLDKNGLEVFEERLVENGFDRTNEEAEGSTEWMPLAFEIVSYRSSL